MLKILDIGCGMGFRTSLLKKRGDVVGIDVDDELLGKARKNYPKIQFVNMSAENLKFDAETFDEIYCHDVLEHVDHLNRVLQEIARVTKENGRLIIEVPYWRSEKLLLRVHPAYWEEVHHVRLFQPPRGITRKETQNHAENAIQTSPPDNKVSRCYGAGQPFSLSAQAGYKKRGLAENSEIDLEKLLVSFGFRCIQKRRLRFITNVELVIGFLTGRKISNQEGVFDRPLPFALNVFFQLFNPQLFSTRLRYVPLWIVTLPLAKTLDQIFPKTVRYTFVKSQNT